MTRIAAAAVVLVMLQGQAAAQQATSRTATFPTLTITGQNPNLVLPKPVAVCMTVPPGRWFSARYELSCNDVNETMVVCSIVEVCHSEDEKKDKP